MTPPVALTVAGSDPSGGAGLQADLRTFAALGVHGTSVVAAITVQDTIAVHRVQPVDAELVAAQLEAVTSDLAPAATKTGLLATAANVECVATAARSGRLGVLVVDPVLRASTGAVLTPDRLAGVYRQAILPTATLLTPNRDEAVWLTGRPVTEPDHMRRAALELAELGPRGVVVTGGRRGETTAFDVLVWDGTVYELVHEWVVTPNTHGTGCTFAAAVTAGLARGHPVPEAVDAAGRFVARSLAGAAGWRLGAGPGPLDQLGWDCG